MRVRLAAGFLALVSAVACAEGGETPAGPETLVVPAFTQAPDGGAKNLRTHASGSEEVPANDSKAQGQATFTISEDGTELAYKLVVANSDDVTQSHIHMAAPGANGGIVAWLYPSAPPLQLIEGRSQGVLASGVITDDDVVGALAGTGVAGLIAAIRAGNTYVNVHTLAFPPGEIRGQID
jgi:hypothetical protein